MDPLLGDPQLLGGIRAICGGEGSTPSGSTRKKRTDEGEMT